MVHWGVDTMSQTMPETTPAVMPPPAYFLSLTVEDFRCFRHSQKLNLSDTNNRPSQWTVILGENNTGKTTILQCLAVGNDRYGRDERDNDFVFNDRFREMANQLLWRMNGSRTDNSRIHRSVCVGGGLKDNNGILVDLSFPLLSSDFANIVSKGISTTGLICYGYGASRLMSRKAIPEERGRSCETLFDNNSELFNAEEWLVAAYYATRVEENPRTAKAKIRLDRIKEVLTGNSNKQGLLPHVSDLRFTTTKDDAMIPRVEAETPYGWVSVRGLSLGYQTALAWVVDFASRMFERYPDSANPLAEPAICLVDEIDLHLHPKWQRELLRLLSDTFPKTQFIVTAHSPLIVQAAPNANLALLRREGDHVVIDNDVDHIRKWRVDQILASELFGEQPTYAPEVEKLLDERTRLAQKGRLSDKEQARLAELDRDIEQLPTAAGAEDREARDIIRRAAALLKNDL
jgi:predicted ATPase